MRLSTSAAEEVVSLGARLRGSDMSTGIRDTCALDLLPSGHPVLMQHRYTWLWATGSHSACLARRDERPSVRQRWQCPLWHSSPAWGSRTRRSSLGLLFVLPSFTLVRNHTLMNSGAEESNPAFSHLTVRPAQYPGVRAPTSVQLSCRTTDAAC
jgi:hypothetical protein